MAGRVRFKATMRLWPLGHPAVDTERVLLERIGARTDIKNAK